MKRLFKVIEDFLKRIDNYKIAYEPTSKEDYKVVFFFIIHLIFCFSGNQDHKNHQFREKRKRSL